MTIQRHPAVRLTCHPSIKNFFPEKDPSYRLKRIRSRVHEYHNIALAVAAAVLIVRIAMFGLHIEGADAALWFAYDAAVIVWLLFATALNSSRFFRDPYRWVPALKTRSTNTDWIAAQLEQEKTLARPVSKEANSVEIDWLSKFAARAFPNSRIWPERRHRLFVEWKNRRSDSLRWIVRGSEVIGYTCILPLRHEAAENMKRGSVSWYEIRPTDIAGADERVACLFVQAICIDHLFNIDPDAVDLAINSFADHVAEMLFAVIRDEAGSRGASIPIVAEATSVNTRAFLRFAKYEEMVVRR